MCGIAALQLRDPSLQPRLGELLSDMLCEIVERGPDSAGIALYGDERLNPAGTTTVSVLDVPLAPEAFAAQVRAALPEGVAVTVQPFGETTVVTAAVPSAQLEHAVSAVVPGARFAGRGENVTVMKGTGHPMDLAAGYDLATRSGTQALSHTRMATESAVTASGAHPFTVSDDLCLVHNGSFSNHATIRRGLRAQGVVFDSDNDSEVAARYIAWRMREGDSLSEALARVQDVFDGFYTLVVTTKDSLAVVRDPIACKPAIIAETDDWVAMASEYRALAKLPGIEHARIFEPEPGRVYLWTAGRTVPVVTAHDEPVTQDLLVNA
jgi:glutamate synthase domain-containing protein 1